MESNRVNLDAKNNIVYIVLTIVLVILSATGIFLLVQIKNVQNIANTDMDQNDQPNQLISNETIPTTVIQQPVATTSPTISLTPKMTGTIPSAPIATSTSNLIPTSTSSATLNYESTKDEFSVAYSNQRKVYEDTEESGNRYTFKGDLGNIVVHVGLDNKWSWVNSERDFTNAFLVSGKPTFKYDISTQTIVDLQANKKNYTIQCVHMGKADQKKECEEFLKNFKILSL